MKNKKSLTKPLSIKRKLEIKKLLKSLAKPYDTVWWDFDGDDNVGIECANPPHNKNFLLVMKDSRSQIQKDREGSAKLIDVAEAIVDLINEVIR